MAEGTKLLENWSEKLSKLGVEDLTGAGIAEQDARDYITKLTGLYQLQKELTEPAANNHGLPRNLTEEDRVKLNAAYQELLNSTERIRKQYRKTEHEDLESKMSQIRSVLYDDFRYISLIAANKVSLPLSAAMFNAEKQVVSGSLESADQMGGALSSRIVTTIRDEEGHERTGFFTKESRVGGDTRVAAGLVIGNGARVDSRNSSMSAVASLLGRGDLLAHSQNMVVTTGDNRQNGTFMEFASGTDLDHALPDDPYFQSKSTYAHSAKIDMMDLSIIDYLCLNVDRHTGNIFFRYGEPDSKTGVRSLVGLVGIDNDGSFGAKNPRPDQTLNRLASLQETVVISASMAKKIRELTPEVLKSVLRKNGLEENAIDAAVERLETLQTMLENGREISEKFDRIIKQYQQDQADKKTEATDKEGVNEVSEFYKDPYKYVKSKKPFGVDSKGRPKLGLMVVEDNATRYLTVKSLGTNQVNTGYTYGIFGGVKLEHEQSRRRMNMGIARQNAAKSKAKVQNSAILQIAAESRQGLSKRAGATIDRFLAEAKSRTGIRGTSAEFEDIRKTMQGISNLSKRFAQEGYVATDMDMNLMEEYYNRLSKNCIAYTDKKQAEVAAGNKLSGYAEKRVNLVKLIKEEALSFRRDFRILSGAENLKSNVKLAAQADEIYKFAGSMKPLDTKTAKPEEMKAIAEALVGFVEKYSENPNMQSVIKVYEKKLTDQIAEKGGFETCKIDGELKSKLEQMIQAQEQPGPVADVKEPVKTEAVLH